MERQIGLQHTRCCAGLGYVSQWQSSLLSERF